jgi:hypothetical protein
MVSQMLAMAARTKAVMMEPLTLVSGFMAVSPKIH